MIHHSFSQLVDIEQVRQLPEFRYRVSGMHNGLFNADEYNLIKKVWQDICTRFHRVNPVTCAYSREGDAFIKAHLHDKQGATGIPLQERHDRYRYADWHRRGGEPFPLSRYKREPGILTCSSG